MAKRRREQANEDGPPVLLVGVVRVQEAGPSSGYRMVRVEMPESVAEQYITEATPADMRGIAVGRAVALLERHSQGMDR